MNDWVGEPRPAPAELAENYEPRRYDENDHWIALLEAPLSRLNKADLEDLSKILGAYPIDPSILHD